MKKFLGLSLSALMVAALSGCGGNNVSSVTNYAYVYSSDVQNLDYVTSQYAVDHQVNANLVDGLLENSTTGELVGALAESWESNDDATVWTFHLREGVQWVTSEGVEYGEVTAQDFVTGLQHAVDFESGTAWLLEGVLKNFVEYERGAVTFDEVGVKAVDTYTVEYTMEQSTPYFDSMTTYAILYPINATFLESQGVGCKLGEPDRTTCSFGSVDPSSILYNGGYLLTALDSKSHIQFQKNENYWDAEHVYVETVDWYFDDGSDPYSVINGFAQGTYTQATLSASWEDFEEYVEEYKDYYYPTLPNSACFGTNFNYNRQSYNYTAHTTDAEKENTQNAIRNANFRRAYMAAFDRVAYLTVNTPEEVAVDMLRNMNQFPDIVTAPDGTSYTELVNNAYEELTGEAIDLSDGQDPFLNKEKALEYIEAAKAEGVQFPVTLDLLAIGDQSQIYIDRANSMKQSVEANTDGQIIINVILQSYDVVNDICYRNQDPARADYDINTFSGWSPDYADPKSFVDIYSTSSGAYMHTLGLALDDENDPSSQEAKAEVGLDEYERLYREADAITTDMQARYEAFAKADAYMVANAIMVPQQMDARGYVVTKVVPFTRSYSNTGISEYKYKFMRVQEETVTREQYDAAYEEWLAAREAQ
ncbi:peptide ABC transporter substrate-binding protein [uncultured Traorella sp.]|uniref:peptide ABC transporter substrate-binding protein n=1 Tax=uncultured Traorella sp. TaxID=1929048 RepID=UPI0025D29F7A|nr:peptide ABC transporter substrate-binding protein [uncultured Traorella sp.]